MKVVFTPTAVRQLENQLAYLVSKGAQRAASATRERISTFINDFLAVYPGTGRPIPEKQIYEIWIPRTRYVVFYRIEAGETLRILFHTAQDRSAFTIEDGET